MRLQPRAERRRTRLSVEYGPMDGDEEYREGLLTNVSSTGLFVETREPEPPLTILGVLVPLGDEAVNVLGEVVRTVGAGSSTQAGAGMGIRILTPDSAPVRRLQESFSA